MVLKQKITSKRQKSSLIYSSQVKSMILAGANNVLKVYWFTLLCPFLTALFHYVILMHAKTLRSVSFKTLSRAFKNSSELNTETIRLKFFVFIQHRTSHDLFTGIIADETRVFSPHDYRKGFRL